MKRSPYVKRRASLPCEYFKSASKVFTLKLEGGGNMWVPCVVNLHCVLFCFFIFPIDKQTIFRDFGLFVLLNWLTDSKSEQIAVGILFLRASCGQWTQWHNGIQFRPENWFDSLNFDFFCTIQSIGKQNGTCDGGKNKNKIPGFLLPLRY